MVDVYIKHTDNNYYKLDLEPSESINFKLTAKDLTDITKIFAPFTQSFNLKATDKNKILCGFFGNEKILKVNNNNEFDSLIYISGFLFQSGKLTFEQTDYEFLDQKGIKTTFASNLTSLTDKLGDLTIQDLFMDDDGNFDDNVKVDWGFNSVRNRLSSILNVPLSNGIVLKYGIPFISNKRVWNYNENLTGLENIAYNPVRNDATVNYISRDEVRPAVNYMAIMQHLLLKIGSPVVCPIFENPEVKDLMAWCNSENLVVPDAAAIPIINYEPITYLRYDERDDNDGIPQQTIPKWTVTGGGVTGVFRIKRNETITRPANWYDGIDVNLTFNNLTSLEGVETKIKVVLKNAANNSVIDSQEITGANYTYRIIDEYNGFTQLDGYGEIYLKFEILPVTLVDFDSVKMFTVQKFFYKKKTLFKLKKTYASFSATALNYTTASELGGGKLNLITTLPKMKCTDFLKSFFKMFNISVISTGLSDQSMYWVTPENIKEVNQPYSKRIVDYTNYVEIQSTSKEIPSKYNVYSFSHADSKYYDAVYGNGKKFGALTYPEILPSKPTKFEVETDYSIIKQTSAFSHPDSLKMCLGFENDTPEVLETGANRFKPVYDEFTIFYLRNVSLEGDDLGVEFTETTNLKLSRALEATIRNPLNNKSLAFGAEGVVTSSLYLNNYKDFIELLLNPNTYSTEFTLTLPPNEIFLNFANLKQGESNIPTGFRIQNEIIIGEQRYIIEDSTINLTNQKTKLTLLNI